MREIKFRAWDEGEKQMHLYNEHHIGRGFGTLLFSFNPPLPDYGVGGIKNILIEQYTGLKDKNGKEIYEGDIIRCLEYSNPIEALAKGEGQYNFAPIGWDETGGAFRCMDYYLNEFDYTEEVEIIGNIHETPELIP